MSDLDLEKDLSVILRKEQIHRDEPMARHTTFGVGGPCDWFLMPETVSEFISLVKYFREKGISYLTVGGGANLLVRDKGIRGAVIWTGKFSGVEILGNTLTAFSGTPTALVAKKAWEAGLSGLEFAAGIPGTIGGAAYMNAGAFDGEMAKVVTEIRTCDAAGCEHCYDISELGYGYRTSRFMENPETILEITMRLSEGNAADISAKMEEYRRKRSATQPLSRRSAGSTFKRPVGVAAAKLIDDAGLKGFSVGDAAVSEKHAGFIVNLGHATCADILAVMARVSEKVNEKYGILLEPEVWIVGED